MARFFVAPEQVGADTISIYDGDVNHIRNVLRMRVGDALSVSDGTGTEYHCRITAIEKDAVLTTIEARMPSCTELPVQLILFQGLPKSDKMEWIVQKAVELGVHAVVPVSTSRSIVKLDEKKAAKKRQRWQQIAESGAKQSGRARIPEVRDVMRFRDALAYAETLDAVLIPYEKAENIAETRALIEALKTEQEEKAHTGGADAPFSIGIFIGPEGGFAEEEIALAEKAPARPITLGKRILRTETAGLAVLSILMFAFEG